MSNLLSNSPRGIRNNNWLNIKYRPSNNWKGQIGHDEEFCIFSDPIFGIRAAKKIIGNYLKRQPHMTIEEMICTWSHTDQNDYVFYVTHHNNFFKVYFNEIASLGFDDWCKLFLNMAEFENGRKSFYSHIDSLSAKHVISRGLSMK